MRLDESSTTRSTASGSFIFVHPALGTVQQHGAVPQSGLSLEHTGRSVHQGRLSMCPFSSTAVLFI